MLRTHNCGELRIDHVGQTVTLCGWVQRTRDKGSVFWVDLRDRYGTTQLILDESVHEASLFETGRTLGREYVLQATGKVIERISKNNKIPTGDVEVSLNELKILNPAKLPPFLIEDETDGGEDLRMKYRYLDLRRGTVQQKLILRHKTMQETRRYLSDVGFLEVETPVLIKSTPEGARDFVVPSRMNPGQFYALPQSPQTFKQLLMVGGFDKYFQIVKCFRDEDLRADRQPEFTQIDCEMSFVEQPDVLETFEGLTKHLFKSVINVQLPDFPLMEYSEAMEKYGVDKPDTRFGMLIEDLSAVAKGKGFKVFDEAEIVAGILVEQGADQTRKELDALINWVKRPQIGAKGLVWVKYNIDGSFSSTVGKFFGDDDFKAWFEQTGGQTGDLLLLVSDSDAKTRTILGQLRLHIAQQMGLRKPNEFNPLWVVNFPLVEWDQQTERFYAMHHPFTSPHPNDLDKLEQPGQVRANAYDLVINGVEIGGGSIRIHERPLQEKMFKILGLSEAEAKEKFSFLMDAFEYGAPPHGGIAFGFDRICALMGGSETIRDYIAFPKNTSGHDVMIEAPSAIDDEQLKELSIKLTAKP